MKKIFYVFGMLCFAVAGCRTKQAQLADFIPGMYVRTIDHEFAVGADTLVINRMQKDALVYLVVKQSGYQRRRNGKLLPYEYRKLVWTAVLDKETGLLQEQREGKVLVFKREEGVVFLGGMKYQKTP